MPKQDKKFKVKSIFSDNRGLIGSFFLTKQFIKISKNWMGMFLSLLKKDCHYLVLQNAKLVFNIANSYHFSNCNFNFRNCKIFSNSSQNFTRDCFKTAKGGDAKLNFSVQTRGGHYKYSSRSLSLLSLLKDGR